ncbi:DUF2897 family protein [Vibrio aquaticus]|uniref:DUF2897 family protein n=1 Tax=Vibrio aquaticus TaxID=2496559 RepID=A0A432CY16_9VIBR|nr:DUF2897 family protein [Vibrio aquaticus]RTZ15412.1 DUF2897 family protein [Vibrio aquaticus]
MEFLTNPWVIIVIVLSVIIGNIAALKYTAKMKFGPMTQKPDETAADKKEPESESDKHSQ